MEYTIFEEVLLMLKSYEICNFKSYKDKTNIELERTNYQALSETNVKNNILKGLMFVGANASGKSNSMHAIKFLLDCLIGKNDINIDSYCCMFARKPIMSLQYVFEIDGTEIVYRIEYQRIDMKLGEMLQVDGEEVFTRDGSVASSKLYEEQTFTDVPKDMLFLRDIYFNTKFRGWIVLQKWFEFLSNSVYIDLYTGDAFRYRDINVELDSYIEHVGTEEINNFFEEYNFEQSIEYGKKAKGHIVSIGSMDKMIFFKRKGIDEPIPFSLESLGNRVLLQLLPSFFHCIQAGGMLLLDEFSSGFHNDLEELLVRYFMKKAENAQLIFVSHSTNLLSNRILRPDQIYSVDFTKEGSVVKRFSSEKPREAQNLEKMYLGGVFNGVPRYEDTIK